MTDRDTSQYSALIEAFKRLPNPDSDKVRKVGEILVEDLIEMCPEWCFICKKHFPCEHFETSWKDRKKGETS